MEQGTQYLVKLADGLDYARVEPWQGGLSAAKREAESIGGYVVALDDDLCSTGEIVADYRAHEPAWHSDGTYCERATSTRDCPRAHRYGVHCERCGTLTDQPTAREPWPLCEDCR